MRLARLLPHPADLSHALPRPTLRDHAVRGSRRGNRSGGLGNADRGIGTERPERRAALDGARGCPGARRRGGVRHPESVRRPAAARQAGAGRSRPWHLQLRRPEHGCAELLPLRRSGGRNRRPRNAAVAGVDSRTLPDADGAGQERLTAWFVYGSAPLEHNHEAVTLVPEMRKPFDVLAEGLLYEKSRGDWTQLELSLAGIRDWGVERKRIIIPEPDRDQ